MRILFQPEIIAKSRKNTSTFSTAGRAVTQIGTLPVNAGKGVFHGVTGVFKKGDHDEEPASDSGNGSSLDPVHASKQVFHGVTGIFKKGDREPEPDITAPSGQASQPANAAGGPLDHPTAGVNVPMANGDDRPQNAGTLHVMVMDAKDISINEVKPYVIVRCGDREVKTRHVGKTATPEWNETFKFVAGPMTSKLYIWVHDHKTLGKDKALAEGEIDIWRHVQASSPSPVDVTVELRHSGLLRVRLDFDPIAGSVASLSSGDKISRTTSITASPSRFSIGRPRRSAAVDSDD